MAATMNETGMSDEVWLISRARACMKPTKSDPYAAKAWMITARSLFPNNFSIQVHITLKALYCLNLSNTYTFLMMMQFD